MHLPPAISYEVVRSRWHFCGLCLMWGGTALCAVAFAYFQSHSSFSASVLLACTIDAPLSFWAWKRSAVGRLQWDGNQWFWSGFGDVAVQAIRISLDLQGLMLVQLRSMDGVSVWLFLERSTRPTGWLALRRALFVHHGARKPAPQHSGNDGLWQ